MIISGEDLRGRHRIKVDAVVVGSGAGGAPVAKELAEGGLKVAVIEEGPAFSPEQMNGRPREMLPRLYRNGGQTVTLGNPPIVVPVGRGVGGTTLVNSGTCFRTPQHVIESWRTTLDLPDLDPIFERVERTIHVQQVDRETAGRNAHVAQRGAEALGWSGGYIARNAKGCIGSGVCPYGCPRQAKQHTGISYLPLAHEQGAVTYADTRVTGLSQRHAEARTKAGGRLHVEADRVIIAAGTLLTPSLLHRAGIRNPHLGRHLSLHPATALWAVMPEPIDLHQGVPQSYFVDEFAPQGIMLEGVGGPPDYVAMALPFSGERHREYMLRYRHLAQLGLMVSDTSRGRVHLRTGIVRYDLNATDAQRIRAGIAKTQQLLEAAGAEEVINPSAHGRLKLMAFHPLGTARMGDVVDATGRVHGTETLYVADGSIVPSALGVNPQITIMTLATHVAFGILERACPSSSTVRGSTPTAAS